MGRENLPITVGAVLVLGLLLTYVLQRRMARTFAWLREGREPTPAEHRLTLRMPAFTASLTAVAWAFGSLLGFLLNVDHSFDSALLIAVAVWLGGETTSALSYLFCERTIRPGTALALAARAPRRPTLGVRNRLVIAWSLGTAVPMLSILGVGIAGLAREDVDPVALAGACVFLGTVALGTGLLAILVTARAISEPLNVMRSAIERVGAGDLEVQVPVDDSTEVGLLQAGFNRMAEGLRERARIRDIFGRQVGEDVARSALSEGVTLGGEEREVGALFVDITGSTSMALAMPPSEVVRLLNKFFRVVVEAVEREGGLVNKFQGDAALCVFGAPVDQPRTLPARPCGPRARWHRGSSARCRRSASGSASRRAARSPATSGPSGASSTRSSAIRSTRPPACARWPRSAPSGCSPPTPRCGGRRRRGRAWAVGERTVLRGRLEATGLALPRA